MQRILQHVLQLRQDHTDKWTCTERTQGLRAGWTQGTAFLDNKEPQLPNLRPTGCRLNTDTADRARSPPVSNQNIEQITPTERKQKNMHRS